MLLGLHLPHECGPGWIEIIWHLGKIVPKPFAEEILTKQYSPQVVGASCWEKPHSSDPKEDQWVSGWPQHRFGVFLRPLLLRLSPTLGTLCWVWMLSPAVTGIWTWMSLGVLMELYHWAYGDLSELLSCEHWALFMTQLCVCVSVNNINMAWPSLHVLSCLSLYIHVNVFRVSYNTVAEWFGQVAVCHRYPETFVNGTALAKEMCLSVFSFILVNMKSV